LIVKRRTEGEFGRGAGPNKQTLGDTGVLLIPFLARQSQLLSTDYAD
jgi:hypothetical protein